MSHLPHQSVFRGNDQLFSAIRGIIAALAARALELGLSPADTAAEEKYYDSNHQQNSHDASKIRSGVRVNLDPHGHGEGRIWTSAPERGHSCPQQAPNAATAHLFPKAPPRSDVAAHRNVRGPPGGSKDALMVSVA